MGGGYALSQYICPQSAFNDDDATESDCDDDDPIHREQRLQLKQTMAQVQPVMSLYKRYLKWFSQHDVLSHPKYVAMIEADKIAAVEEAAREAEQLRLKLQHEEHERQKEQKRYEAEQYRIQ